MYHMKNEVLALFRACLTERPLSNTMFSEALTLPPLAELSQWKNRTEPISVKITGLGKDSPEVNLCSIYRHDKN